MLFLGIQKNIWKNIQDVNDRQIVVNDFYIGKEPLNEYFKYHKLNSIYHIILQFVLYHIL